ncbi:hypothetical protein NDA10_003793 [Ustilago hordei]|nr:hypothetical protein NDA10_003793 [Ustilago hordei]
MDSSSEDKQSEGIVKEAEHKLVTKTQIDDELFGLMATCLEQSKNLDPTAMGTWEITDLPKGANTIDTCWVLKIKTDANLVPTKFKARLIAQGFMQCKGIDYTEVFALNQSTTWKGTESSEGAVQFKAIRLCNEVDCTKQEIMSKWETQDNGEIKEFLGIKITHDRRQRRISLDLTAYVKAMVNKWLEGANNKLWVPMPSVANIAGGKKCNPKQVKKYQELVGQLLWVSNTTQPDITFAVGTLAQYMSSPINSAWKAATHMVKYLNQMSRYQLHLGGGSSKHMDKPIMTYTNVNWALDPTNGWRSTSGSITYIYGCPVSWKSHIQKCVALSAVEAEFVAASKAV